MTSYIITNYVQNQGDQEEKQVYKQMKRIDFQQKNYIKNAGANITRCLQRGAPAQV